MAVATKTAVLVRDAMNNAINTYAGAGAKLIIYGSDGTPTVPASIADGLGGASVLATLTLHAGSSFLASSGGVLTADTIADVTATGTGTAAFFRLYKADGTTKVWQGTVGTSASDLVANTTSFVTGISVSVSAATYTLGE